MEWPYEKTPASPLFAHVAVALGSLASFEEVQASAHSHQHDKMESKCRHDRHKMLSRESAGQMGVWSCIGIVV